MPVSHLIFLLQPPRNFNQGTVFLRSSAFDINIAIVIFFLDHLMWFLVVRSHKYQKFSIWGHVYPVSKGKTVNSFFFFFFCIIVVMFKIFCCTSFLLAIFFCGKEKLQCLVASQKLFKAHEGSALLLALCRSPGYTLQFFMYILILI